ncbi:WYL domain-containing protein [Vibrio hyugaensis]|uniref:WYL domain-containing protein n=1 Tax=Vibrio hyugaensis TaxID=1534743 RepID=UPI000CE550BE|nr:WYL domain-containing protein [Vibrio hyugaensis]
MQDIKWDQALRFRLIEIIALWEGRLTTNHLCSAFRIGRQQASRDINKYQNLFDTPPLELDRSIKGYKPAASFSPRFSQGTANEYLTFLHQQNQIVESFDFFEMGHAESAVLMVPERSISPIIVRSLIQAAREQRRVDIDYVSLSTPKIVGRNIVPHTIVNDGIRWHVRAYCEHRSEYRDFVLSRFRNVPDLLDRSNYGRDRDTDWNEMAEIEVIPNPYLEPAQQKIIAEDYGMNDGRLAIKSRNALVKYIVQRLNISLDENQLCESPKAFQLTVKDREAIRPHMINSFIA